MDPYSHVYRRNNFVIYRIGTHFQFINEIVFDFSYTHQTYSSNEN